MYDGINLAFAFVFIICCVFIFVWIMFVITMDKLIQAVRVENDEFVYISRAWAWTQLIPGWNFIALIVYHVKILNIIRILEVNYKLEKNDIKYPVVSGWIYICSVLYAFIPIFGPVVVFVSFIIFWMGIYKSSLQALSIKAYKEN